MPGAATLYRAAMLPGNDLGNVTSETLMPDGRGVPLSLPLPSNNSLANKSFRIRCSGRLATPNSFTINLYFGREVRVFSSGAHEVRGLSHFDLWLDLVWHADTRTITGRGEGQLADDIVAPSALLASPSADPDKDSNTSLASLPPYFFSLKGFFSEPSPRNLATVTEFCLEDK